MSKYVDQFEHLKTKPVTFTWVIENFNYIYADWVESPEIKLSSNNLKMCLTKARYNKNRISFKLEQSNPGLCYRISLINDKGQKFRTQEGPVEHSEYNIGEDYPDRKLSNGNLTIYAEFFEFGNIECIQSGLNNLISQLQRNQSLLDSGKWSDVVLVVGEREFKAHKAILSAGSVVFEKMFEESKGNRVQITDMSAGVCEQLLKLIYTGKVDALDQYAYELFAAADKYKIDSLKSHCELYLTVSLSLSTISKTLQLAHQYSVETLKSKCIDYIHLHWKEFKYDNWNELTTRYPELMYRVFQLHESIFKH